MMGTVHPTLAAKLLEMLYPLGVYLVQEDTANNLTLHLYTTKEVDPLWFRLAVNLFGDGPELPFRSEYYITWYVTNIQPHHNVTFFTLVVTQIPPEFSWEEQIALLSSVLKIGLNPPQNHSFKSIAPHSRLVRVYLDLNELETFYEEWLSEVYSSHLLDKGYHCGPALYNRGLCCNQHITLGVQYKIFHEWFMYFHRDKSYDGKSAFKGPFLTSPPSERGLLAELSAYFVPYLSAYTFLESYLNWMRYLNDKKLTSPQMSCLADDGRTVRGLCCTVHVVNNVMYAMFALWARVYDDKHGISRMKYKDETFTSAGIFSANWIELLIYLEGLDRASLSSYLKYNVDVHGFHL